MLTSESVGQPGQRELTHAPDEALWLEPKPEDSMVYSIMVRFPDMDVCVEQLPGYPEDNFKAHVLAGRWQASLGRRTWVVEEE